MMIYLFMMQKYLTLKEMEESLIDIISYRQIRSWVYSLNCKNNFKLGCNFFSNEILEHRNIVKIVYIILCILLYIDKIQPNNNRQRFIK